MIPLTTTEIRNALQVPAAGHEGRVTGVRTDSREVVPGDCFVGLVGTRTSGARFVEHARQRGAVVSVVGRDAAPAPDVLVVDDPVVALARIASLVRDRFSGPVVGITGSAGKTTVKEFLRTLLPDRIRALFPQRSFNNLEGVSRTLTGLEPDHDVLVVELGTSAPGEIRTLTQLARPTVGVLTAIGPAHLQGLGTPEGVLEEKLDLARALPPGSRLFVNGDDPRLSAATYPESCDVVRVGLDAGDAVPPRGSGDGILVFEGTPISHPLGTRVLLRNLWIALHVAHHLGAGVEELASAARDLHPAPLRGEVRVMGGARVVIDCYNANPLSMAAALDELGRAPAPRSAVLGEMLDLGDASDALHRELGGVIAAADLDAVVWVGPHAAVVRAGIDAAGRAAPEWTACDDAPQARAPFAALAARGGTVLIKASRGIALERVLEADHG